MKVLFATSEAAPFAASGRLADVSSALSCAMRKRLIGCRVALPLYEDVPDKLRENLKFVVSLSVPVAWRRQYCGVYKTNHNGVIYYLLDNQYYFKRCGLYGHYDDSERFAFFSRAVLEMIEHIDFWPDILHSNDWQSALVPVYYNLFYRRRQGYENIKNVYTIHNIHHQGKFGLEILEDVFGIPRQSAALVEHDGCINLMKAGIEAADCVTTIGPTYLKEICEPWQTHGPYDILKDHKRKLHEILSSIDDESCNPESDTHSWGRCANEYIRLYRGLLKNAENDK
ncbi:MAG: glycogen/starch synthase [Oscillospiraceae bacterium]|jgi:starch synthase|nr:glycogen/starch synthase [Oscillospiraceae bacterium]